MILYYLQTRQHIFLLKTYWYDIPYFPILIFTNYCDIEYELATLHSGITKHCKIEILYSYLNIVFVKYIAI